MQKMSEDVQHFPGCLKQSNNSIDFVKVKKSNLPFKCAVYSPTVSTTGPNLED